MPLIVVSLLGTEANAYYALPWLISEAVTVLLWNISSSYITEASNDVRQGPALMRRAYNDAMTVAKNRVVFGQRIIDMPLARRQLMKIMLATEQALSMSFITGDALDRAEAGSQDATVLDESTDDCVRDSAGVDAVLAAADQLLDLVDSHFPWSSPCR